MLVLVVTQQNRGDLPGTGTEFEITVPISIEKKTQVDKPSQRDGSESTGEGQRVLKENIMGSTTGRHESVEFMGPETVSRRNFWNVYKFKQSSLLKCGREDEILPIFGDC